MSSVSIFVDNHDNCCEKTNLVKCVVAVDRTTRDYEGPSVAPRVQAALDAAMNNIEEDIDIDALAISNAFAVKGTRKEKSKKSGNSGGGRPKSSRIPGAERRSENYPQSRGLVPK